MENKQSENIREYLRVKELQDNDKSEEMLEEIFEKTTKKTTVKDEEVR